VQGGAEWDRPGYVQRRARSGRGAGCQGRARSRRGRRGRATPRPKQGSRGHAMAVPWPVGPRSGRGGGGGWDRWVGAGATTVPRPRQAGDEAGAPRRGRRGRAAPGRPHREGRRGGARGIGGRGLTTRGEAGVEGAVPVGDKVVEEEETSCMGKKETCARSRGEREIEAVWGGGGADGWAPPGWWRRRFQPTARCAPGGTRRGAGPRAPAGPSRTQGGEGRGRRLGRGWKPAQRGEE
jgi:hypothetical protein